MTTTEIQQEIEHYKWVRKLKNNNVSLAVFKAKLFWIIPDYTQLLDYESKNIY